MPGESSWARRWAKAKWHIQRGEIPPLWELIPNRYQPASQLPGLRKVDENQRRAWVDHEYEVTTVTYEDWNNYYAALLPTDEGGGLTATLNPPEPVDSVSFHLLNTHNADAIEATATGFTDDGDTVRSRAFFRKHNEFWTSDTVPVQLSFESPVTKVDLEVKITGGEDNTPSGYIGTPTISAPSVQNADGSETPVFLITVDTLRRDAIDAFELVIDALGASAVIPEEPWTQGHWTRPSHATMLTGTHPGTHGYVAGINTPDQVQKLSSEIPRLPEMLSEAGYQCSACVGQGTITPKYGFGGGFQSFVCRQRDYEEDHETAASNVNQARQWLEDAVGQDGSGTNIFYFLHLFDPHYPYLPPISLNSGDKIDIPEIVEFKDTRLAMEDDVTELRRGGETFREDALERIRSTYERAVEETAEELVRLIEWLKRKGVFDDAFIIITGDHGEMFFERGFAQHTTLHDENLSPLMMIKPPADSDLYVPDKADTIDFAPTICDVAGVESAEEFAGDSWVTTPKERLETRPRVAESIQDDWYSIAVQDGGCKGIFYWPTAFPDRPKPSTVEEPPEHVEFYDPEVVRKDPGQSGIIPSEDEREKLLEIARSFVLDSSESSGTGESVSVSDSTMSRLESLGYK
jgi:arylsulfatase A-like enzyme